MSQNHFFCYIRKICSPIIIIFSIVHLVSAQTGSIRGTIKAADNQIELEGSNIQILSTNIGSVADSNGVYIISNLAPATYSIRVNFIGYKKTTIKNIAVYSGQTTEINFYLEEEVLGGDEVTIYAESKMLNPEISNSSINLDLNNLENTPIFSIEEAVSLQAGIEPNMSIRGGN
ncbi:MAG: carboxypeptidase-like regulatory domain-containing protein, partial [Candidatus Neomarinimicrobiota bacterium]|nr:carboxypeptidase-like regulatory domain-containing protein [Candidatus Neomarinimicrobiota bacterium]